MPDRETIVVHRHDPRNIGDMSCAPTSYTENFPWLADATTIDIENDIPEYADRLREANVILGGGGLLGAGFFDTQLAELLSLKPHKLICWGAGHNRHGSTSLSMPTYLERFDVVGVRDVVPSWHWTPCVSAMLPGLDNPAAPTNEVVIYRHWDDALAGTLKDAHDYPMMSNAVQDLGRVLSFLASGETVVTNSYPGAYWATLMGRRVVIASPFSSKFYGLRFPVPIVTTGDWRDYLDYAPFYPGALELCRRRTRQFGETVRLALNT